MTTVTQAKPKARRVDLRELDKFHEGESPRAAAEELRTLRELEALVRGPVPWGGRDSPEMVAILAKLPPQPNPPISNPQPQPLAKERS